MRTQFRLVARERGEQNKDDGDQQEPAGQAEDEAQGAVERADPAVEHLVRYAEGDQAHHDQGDNEDAGGEADLGDARVDG